MRRVETNSGCTNISHLIDDVGTVVGAMSDVLTMIANGYCFRAGERHELTPQEMQELARGAVKMMHGN